MELFEGKFEEVKSEKFEDYLKVCEGCYSPGLTGQAAGVSMLIRKVAAACKATIEYKKNGDSWLFNFYSTVKNGTFKFKIGEEADETSPDGRKFRSTITVENGRLYHRQVPTKSGDVKESVVERWFEGEILHTTATCEGVVAKFEFIRI